MAQNGLHGRASSGMRNLSGVDGREEILDRMNSHELLREQHSPSDTAFVRMCARARVCMFQFMPVERCDAVLSNTTKMSWWLNLASCSLLLLTERYNLFKVLACSITFFHRSISYATFLQLRRFILFISSETSSSQRSLGLPIGLLDMGFHFLIFFTLLSSCSTVCKKTNKCSRK
jgi:hypothetical protein